MLSLDNSVIKVSQKTKPSTSITDIEQWTTAFTMYLSVLIDKFPFRSQELLQYLSLIRYAARVHKGLGWVIYDYKFRQKASKNKSLLWSIGTERGIPRVNQCKAKKQSIQFPNQYSFCALQCMTYDCF